MSIGRVMSTTNSPNTNLPSAHNRHNALPNIVVLMDLSVISARQSGHLPVVARIRSKHAAQQRVVESRRSQHVNRRFLSGTASRQMQHTLAGIDMSMARSLHSQLAACVCGEVSLAEGSRDGVLFYEAVGKGSQVSQHCQLKGAQQDR